MKLDEVQAQEVQKWVEAGASAAEIQNQLAEAFDLRMTYMEVRFLLDDLKLQLKDREKADVDTTLPGGDTLGEHQGEGGAAEPGQTPPDPFASPGEEEAPLLGDGVSVSVDQITRPGSVVSGKVTFSDGKGAEWYLDQQGRLGLAPQEEGYRPSQTDVMAFQTELQKQLARQGF